MKDDPLQRIFGDIDPVKDLSDADLDSLLPTESLLDRLHRDIDTEPLSWRHRRMWRRTMVISASTVLALAGAAVAVTFLRAPVQDTTRLSCFARVSLESDANVVAYGSHPLSICQSLMHWPSAPGSPAPSGSLCVLSDGSLAGFPPTRKSNVCAALGLPIFDGHVTDLKVAAFEESAQSYFTERPCMKPAIARSEIQRLLKKYNISGWRVEVSGSKAASACATLSIQVSARLVDIVGFVFN
ncbi:MAG: hypothetical protein ACYDB2_10335 [Acidimicrobiales bacterium]